MQMKHAHTHTHTHTHTCVVRAAALAALWDGVLFEAGTLGVEASGVKEEPRPDKHGGDMAGSKRKECEESPWKGVGNGVTEDREGKRLTGFVQSSPISSSLSLLCFFRSPLLIAVLNRAASKARSPLDLPFNW
eukprot:1144869-Pelagomonas_calceolata.AAC.2